LRTLFEIFGKFDLKRSITVLSANYVGAKLMNIPETNGQRRILASEVTSAESALSAKPQKEKDSTPVGQTPEIGYEPDSLVSELLNRLAESDHVRPDVVATARQQLADGSLSNRESAEKTAAAIIGIVQHF
jgi:hypothetical protein